MTMPPSAGDSTTSAPSADARSASAAPSALGLARILQHERALQVAGAVQSGGEPEMPFVQGPEAAEDVENGVWMSSETVMLGAQLCLAKLG